MIFKELNQNQNNKRTGFLSRMIFFSIFLTSFFSLIIGAKGHSQQFASDILKDNKIKTFLIYRSGNPLSYPILYQNQNNQLTVQFDYLSNEPKVFTYEIIHCDRFWNPSDIRFFDFGEGLDFHYINDFQISRTRYSRYYHYEFFFPNEDFNIKLPGNYVLIIKDDDSGEIVATKKFFVVDELVQIEVTPRFSSIVSRHDKAHELDFFVLPTKRITNKQAFISNTEAMLVKNLQLNGSEIYLKPRFIDGNNLSFDYDEENNFDAGNEYYNLNLKDLNATNNQLARIGLENDTIHALLAINQPRYRQPYLEYPDLNGRVFIKVDDPLFNDKLDAEYMMVHFYYKPESKYNTPLYLYGGFTNHVIDENYRMFYHSGDQLYYKQIMLKQGVYNYKFVTTKEGLPVEDFTSGNFNNTENEYAIFIYHRKPGEFFDRIIGFRMIKYPRN